MAIYTEIASMPAGVERVAALVTYIHDGEKKIKEARRLRDQDIRALVADHGPAETARACGMTVATVKAVSRNEPASQRHG